MAYWPGSGRPSWATIRNPRRPAGDGAAPLAWLLVVVHLVIAPLTLPLRAGNPLMPGRLERGLYVNTPFGPAVARPVGRHRQCPEPAPCRIPADGPGGAGQTMPAHTRVLAPAMPAVTIWRLDERTLSIRPEGGYLRWPLDRVFREGRRPMARGQRVVLTGMAVEVVELTADGRPAEAIFRFNDPLDDPSLLWLCYRGGRFERFTPPGVGRSVTIRIGGLLE